MNKLNNLSQITRVVLIALVSIVSAFGAAGDVDQTFAPAVAKDFTYTQSLPPITNPITVQPDGKILVFGTPALNNISGVPKNKMARLNADGSLDNSFNCECEALYFIFSAILQPDGKILVGGGGYYGGVLRLNPNGSLDTTFSHTPSQNSFGATVWAVQPDGKVLISTSNHQNINTYFILSRLNANGSVDSSFASLFFTYSFYGQQIRQLQLLPDGKIMIGGSHPFGFVFRINADGTRDTTFESPSLTTSEGTNLPVIYSFGIQSTGKVVITGNFNTVNGIAKNGFARLNANGSVDLPFTAASASVTRLAIVSNDKIFLGNARLNADGTIDNTYNPVYSVNYWQLDALERVVFTDYFTEDDVTSQRIGRMNADGSADNSFVFAIVGVAGDVTALAIQPDGKVLVGGDFSRVNGIVRRRVARVNADGTLDAAFNAGAIIGNTLSAIALQADGKILIAGDFQSVGGAARTGLARLNADGSLDNSFNPVISGNLPIYAVAVQPDGKILIGGSFTAVNSASRTSLARLNADGNLDNLFNPILGNPYIYSLLVQADGKIMVGGTFSGVNGFNRSNFVRLNSDGSLDSAFNAVNTYEVTQIVQNADGKYTIMSNRNITKRNADGTVDGSFQSPTYDSSYTTLAKRFSIQPDGNIILVGAFYQINGFYRNNIARLKPNGALDVTFLPKGTNSTINTIAAQMDGKILIGGAFSSLEDVARSAVARFTPPVIHQITPFDFDGDGRADIAVFRASENRWYILQSSDRQIKQTVFAIAGDVPAPADFDGDGRTDIAIFRPSNGFWWSLSSSSNSQVAAQWGQAGDVLRPSDFDGDGRADYVVFRPSTNSWQRVSSGNGLMHFFTFGTAGDKPLIGDFDGDGKSDLAIYRPSTGEWWWRSSIDGVQRATRWGISTDIPAPADYDGDGKTDFAVYRASSGTWYILNSGNGQMTIQNFGLNGDKPVPADYDGDGRADIAVFRPSDAIWYRMRSTDGFSAIKFGLSNDVPIPNAFVP